MSKLEFALGQLRHAWELHCDTGRMDPGLVSSAIRALEEFQSEEGLAASRLRYIAAEIEAELAAADGREESPGGQHVGTTPRLVGLRHSVRHWLERLVTQSRIGSK